MPTKKSTYGELRERQFNILAFRNQWWAVADIFTPLRTSVRKYEQWNSIVLKHLYEKENELISLHVVHSEGKPLWEEEKTLRIEGSPLTAYRGQNNMVPVFNSADDAREFNDKWMELMNSPCDITT